MCTLGAFGPAKSAALGAPVPCLGNASTDGLTQAG